MGKLIQIDERDQNADWLRALDSAGRALSFSRLIEQLIAGGPVKGSATSGNYGHAGRPGLVGGSAPSSPTTRRLGQERHTAKKQLSGRQGGTQERKPTGLQAPTLEEAKAFLNGKADNDPLLRLMEGGAYTLGPTSVILPPNQADLIFATALDNLKQAGIDAEEASAFLLQWNISANAPNMKSLGLQELVSEHFHVPLSDWQKERIATVLGDVRGQLAESFRAKSRYVNNANFARDAFYELDRQNKLYPFQSKALQDELDAHAASIKTEADFLGIYDRSLEKAKAKTKIGIEAIYQATQRRLRDAGLTEVNAFRGVTLPDTAWPVGSEVSYGMNALSSWTAHVGVAVSFANENRGSYVLYSKIPAKFVFSLPMTGFGKPNEAEIVVIGGDFVHQSRVIRGYDPQAEKPLVLKSSWTLTAVRGPGWMVRKGGGGSGNFGHAGRPGQVGGSAGPDLAAVAAAIAEKRQMPTQVLEGVILGQQTRFAAKGKWAAMDAQGSFIGPFEATPERALAAHRKLVEEAEHRARADVAYGEAADRVLAGTPTPADLRTIAGGGTKITRTGIERLLKRSGWTDKQIRGFVSRLGIYGETGGGATLYSPAEVAERLAKTPKPTGKSWTGRIITKGGPGSGFHGHAGRPGEVGGSEAGSPFAHLHNTATQKTLDRVEAEIAPLPGERVVVVNPADGSTLYEGSQTGDRFEVDIQPADAANMKDMILTHNHPNGSDPTLSLNDLSFAMTHNLQEMRVVSRWHTYALRRPAGVTWSSADYDRLDKALKQAADASFRELDKRADAGEIPYSLVTALIPDVSLERLAPQLGFFEYKKFKHGYTHFKDLPTKGVQGRIVKGGPGSGFHGHAGRPGERGGSQARRNPLEEAVARMKEAGVQRTVDTSQVDNMDLGRAAYIEDGKLITFHVTDDPDALQQRLAEGVALRGGTPHSELGSGLYGSTVPDYWMGRSTDKYSFLKKLDKGERQRLADLLQQQLDRAKGHFITPSEYDRGVRNLHSFVEQNSHYGAVSLAEQPYNFRFWKPEWLTEHGFEPGKQPAIVRLEARGVFAEVDQSLGETGSQKLIDLGFDGAYMVGGWSNDPQVVIWNPKAIVGYQEEETTVKAFFLAALGYIKGGDGSGNFGHAGRPGERGGSAPGDGADVLRRMVGNDAPDLDPYTGTVVLPDGLDAQTKADVVKALSKATGYKPEEVSALLELWAEDANRMGALGSLGIQEVASEAFNAPLSAWQKKLLEENKARTSFKFGLAATYAEFDGKGVPEQLQAAINAVDDASFYPFQFPILEQMQGEPYPKFDKTRTHLSAAFYDASVDRAKEKVRRTLQAMYDQTQAFFKEAGIKELTVYRGVNLLANAKWKVGDTVQPPSNALSSWTVLESVAEQTFAADPGSVVLTRTVPVTRILSIPQTGFGALREAEVVVLGGSDQGIRVRSKTNAEGEVIKGGEGSGYFHHAGIPGHRGGSAPDGIGTLTGGPAATAAPATAHAQGQAPTHGLTLPTVNLRNRPAVHKQLDSFMAFSPALSKLASSRQPLPKAALTPTPEKHLAEVMRATGTDSKLPTKQNLAIGAKSLFMPVKGQDELDAYMEQRLKEKGPRSAAGSGKGSFFKPSPAKGANAHAQLKKDAKVADGKKLEKTRKKTREETRGLLLSAVEEAARTGNWQSANALQIKYELAGGLETFALLMGYQAVDGGTETGILVLDRSALVMNPTPIVGVTPTPPRGNIQTPLPHQVPGLGRGRVQTPLPRGGAITKGGTGSGNFQHRGIPGHRGGSAPNGGADSSTDSAGLVDIMTAGWSAPDFAYLDREADWVKDLTAKRDAFLAEARTLPKLAPLRERYVGLVQTLQAVEHPEQYPQWVQNLKKAEQDYEQALQDRRDLFVKHFGNETAQRLGYSPLTPDLKGTPVAQEIKTGQTFLNQTVAEWPTKGTGKKKLLRYDVYYSTQRAHFDGGSVVLAHSDKANTVVHETGHFLEAEGKTRDGTPYRNVALNFLEARTAGEYPKSLKQLTGNAYGDGELARPDKFLHPYVGREYPDGRATEVLAMGTEFLYTNPVKFASSDPEHFYLTVGMLQGVIAERPRPMKGGTGSGNFQHHGRPGQRGGSAPNGGPQGDTDRAALVAALAGEAQAPGPEWKRALDQLNATGWAATPSPTPSPTGGTLWNPQAATVQRLEKKRKAFLKALDKTGPSLTDLQARFEELNRRSAIMNRTDPLTEAEKKEWRAIMDEKLIEKKRAADRALFLKHFGNKTPTKPPLPAVTYNDATFQQNYQEAQTFLSRLMPDLPVGESESVVRPNVTIRPDVRCGFRDSEDRIFLDVYTAHGAVHEYGHFLEKWGATENGVSYGALANDYLEGRTKGQKMVSMRAATNESWFNASEMTRPDHFLEPYTGKFYASGATEITSTGLGHLFNDPGNFARKDPDHFLFTLHLLQGG